MTRTEFVRWIEGLPSSSLREGFLGEGWYLRNRPYLDAISTSDLDLGNDFFHFIHHYISDADIRLRDPSYQDYQDKALANYLRDYRTRLNQGAFDQILRTIERAVPGLGLVGKVRQVRQLPECVGDDEKGRTDSPIELYEVGVHIHFDRESWGGRATFSDNLTIDWTQIAEYVLSEVQDVVARSTTEPWPTVLENGKQSMAMPNASMDHGTLTMWFGQRGDPVLRFDPVFLKGL